MEITLGFTPYAILFGVEWFEKDEFFDFNEIAFYFAFIELKFAWK
jgi:hypothetical protein